MFSNGPFYGNRLTFHDMYGFGLKCVIQKNASVYHIFVQCMCPEKPKFSHGNFLEKLFENMYMYGVCTFLVVSSKKLKNEPISCQLLSGFEKEI